jgi:hypothetical protein
LNSSSASSAALVLDVDVFGGKSYSVAMFWKLFSPMIGMNDHQK